MFVVNSVYFAGYARHTNGMIAPPARKDRYHHGNLAEALIAAAVAEIEDHGVEALSLRTVARRAGVSPGAPFRHFASKRTLLAAVADRATRQLATSVTDALAIHGEIDAVGQFRVYGRAYLDWALAHPTHFRVVSDRALIAEEGVDAIAATNRALRSVLTEMIRRGQADGQIVSLLPAEAIALDARAMVYGLARMMIDGHLPEWSDGADARTAMIAALDRFIDRLAP